MTAITFDTLKFTKKLEKAGLPSEQADALLKLLKRLVVKRK